MLDSLLYNLHSYPIYLTMKKHKMKKKGRKVLTTQNTRMRSDNLERLTFLTFETDQFLFLVM